MQTPRPNRPPNGGPNVFTDANGSGGCTLGDIILSVNSYSGNAIPANGALLSISQNTALFAVLGTRFGGDGRTTFALPDLRSAAPAGLTYNICAFGVFPSRN